MAFGKTFYTLKEARAEAKKHNSKYGPEVAVRKLSKKDFPRTKKRYHLGTFTDWLNWG